MAARRAAQAKTLASRANLSSSQQSLDALSHSKAHQLKSTSMTNLLASERNLNPSRAQNGGGQQGGTIKRPASRNALDNIHKGMNAKFTHVQSKVLLQNIRPQQQQTPSRIPNSTTPAGSLRPASNARKSATPTPGAAPRAPAGLNTQSDRSQMINKIKALQEELERQAAASEALRLELERERADKLEALQRAKLELQEKAAESERLGEESHQKLLEAYELADQNRRAADSVLSESRQREEQLRKKIGELEAQLAELREFVAMKEEMMGKMGELREQIRVERERYEEKTRSLNQMFENEKISRAHMRVDQNSNYFRRTKASLQSTDSIDELGAHDGARQQRPPNSGLGASCARSEHDMYGSKLSTRMQDGARIVWKRSRKFASSVITGSLGGLSACRRHGKLGTKHSKSQGREQSFVSQPEADLAHVQSVGELAIAQPQARQHADENSVEQHTSVVEVGVTVGDFIQQQQQQQQQASQCLELTGRPDGPQLAPQVTGDDHGNHQIDVQADKPSLIRVDANNKLTIVTKFNDSECHAHSSMRSCRQQPSSSSSAVGSCSERSRCESSSSGRGTGSDSGSAGSQNGDADSADSKAAPAKSVSAETTTSTAEGQPELAEYRRHKRKSSLFKASAVFNDSQASLNKTFKSFFRQSDGSRKHSETAPSEPPAQLVRHVHSFDESALQPLKVSAAPTTPTTRATYTEQTVPRLSSFKQQVVGEQQTSVEAAH